MTLTTLYFKNTNSVLPDALMTDAAILDLSHITDVLFFFSDK